MSRQPVALRRAELTDAPRLRELWSDILRKADAEDQIGDLEATILRVRDSTDERLILAEVEGQLAGAVLLRAATISPLNSEPVIQIVSPHVFPDMRRRGVGHALLEAAASFAEEQGIHLVGIASLSGSREANRFLARLGLAPQAVFRMAATHQLRAKLSRSDGRYPGRQLGQVIAARRSLRRAQSLATSDN